MNDCPKYVMDKIFWRYCAAAMSRMTFIDTTFNSALKHGHFISWRWFKKMAGNHWAQYHNV